MAWTLPPTHSTGDVLAAGDWNDVVSDLSILETGVALFNTGGYIDGSAPPAVTSPAFLIQGGTIVVLTNGNGGFSVTFPSPFPNGLLTVVACPGDTFSGSQFNMSVGLIGPQCTVNGFGGVMSVNVPTNVLLSPSGSATIGSYQGLATSNCRVNWYAIGY